MLLSTLLHRNPIYVATEYQMLSYQLAYLNGEMFKRNSRRKRPSEDATLHLDLIQHTVAMPITRYVVDTINDVVFEPGVKREIMFAGESGGALPADSQDWAELFELDADLTNTNLNGVMEHVGDLTSIFGHCWVFVDMPNYGGQVVENARPYVCPVSPLNVWDWEFITVRGLNIPKYVKVLERETPECYYIKCYYLGTATTPSYWESYEVEKKDKNGDMDIMPFDTGEFPIGMSIPGFIAYTKRDPRRFELGISDIDVATDVQREVYKLECEAYQAIQFARTLIRADSGIKVPAHAGSIVRATEGQIEAIAIETQDVNTIIAKQQDLLVAFQNLTGFGGLTKQSKQVSSGVSIIEERRQLHRVAKAKARLMEVCEEQIWTYAARFMGVRWAGEVVYGTDYEAHDTQYRLALIEKAKQLLPDDAVINSLVLREVIGMLAPPHEVAEYQEAIRPSLDPTVQRLLGEEANEIYTRDLGNQTPDSFDDEDGGDEDAKEEMIEQAKKAAIGSMNPGIIYTGQSHYTEDAIATQLGFGGVGGR